MKSIKFSFNFFHELIADDYVEVSVTVTPGSAGMREEGFQVEPDEPDSVEFHTIHVDGKTVEVDSLFLPQSVMNEMEEAALEAAADQYEPYEM